MACRLTFKHTHKDVSNEVIATVGQHPNAYFDASMNHYNIKRDITDNDKMELEKWKFFSKNKINFFLNKILFNKNNY